MCNQVLIALLIFIRTMTTRAKVYYIIFYKNAIVVLGALTLGEVNVKIKLVCN
jgi:hypothetical protein